MREGSESSLAGLVPAQTLYNAVCADPSAPLTVGVVGPGGCGKSALLAALHQAYLAAGVSVVRTGEVAVGLTPSLDVAVLVDDAHQLEGPDLDRLRRLALTSDVRLVVTYRPWPRKPELAELETALGAHLPPVLLGRLDRRGIQIRCAALLGGALPAAVVDLLCEQTSGVPMLIDRVVDSLRTAGRIDGGRPELLPEVVDNLRHDLHRIAPPLRALLLAVGLGAAPDAEILAQVLALDPAVVTDLLSMAQASGLLLGGGLGEGATVIPLVRRALVADAAPGTRRVVQRLVLAAHLERGRPVLDLAHQLVEAGARGSDLAAVFEAAADAALSELSKPTGSSDAAARAAQLYAQAVTAGADSASLAPRWAEASALAGDLDGALRLADQALSDSSCPDLARAGNVAAAVLAQRGLLARSAEVYRWVGTAGVGSAGMGSAAPLAALALLGTGSLAQAREVLAASVGDRPPTLVAGAESLMATGVLESVLGSPIADPTTAPIMALSTLTRAAALLEPGGRAVLLPDTPAALAAIVALHCGELDVAVSVLERALACCVGGLFARARYQLLLAWTAMIRGDTALARCWLARTVPESGTLEPREELFAAALVVGLARRESDIPALRTAWAAAREAIVRHPADLFALLPLGELAVAAAKLGDFDRVAPHLDQARILLERLGDPPLWAAPLHWYGLHAAILREQPSAAERHEAALVKAAESNHYAVVLAAAGRAWMRVLAGQVDPSEVESAARGLQSIGLANDGSRLAGQAAIRTTDRKVMVTLLGCARALRATGPGAASPAVAGERDDSPEPMPPSRPAPSRIAAVSAGGPGSPAMLSDREREVAELILTGLTYRQIGERLFISAKTVEHHVARMRQRLNVTSRDELFAQLRMCVGNVQPRAGCDTATEGACP
ncbi:MAG TPA: LuxR C-terminal-related transcriptional regulator [Pseudonocardiaceae bacterium]|jgi:DNA-binding CsgD family transcriptional regulator|nr:LuxR C-terminal-related transcriptional regulator [Pseudonocardiaceae bacterium]